MIRHRLGRCHAPSLILAMGLSVAGCSGSGDGLPREAVSGTVTMDGQPLARGTIRFTPIENRGDAQPGGGVITDGRFSIDREHGLVPGKYKIALNAAGSNVGTGLEKTSGPGRPSRVERPKELIPAKYNAQSTLESEVKKGVSNYFEYTVESKADASK